MIECLDVTCFFVVDCHLTWSADSLFFLSGLPVFRDWWFWIIRVLITSEFKSVSQDLDCQQKRFGLSHFAFSARFQFGACVLVWCPFCSEAPFAHCVRLLWLQGQYCSPLNDAALVTMCSLFICCVGWLREVETVLMYVCMYSCIMKLLCMTPCGWLGN